MQNWALVTGKNTKNARIQFQVTSATTEGPMQALPLSIRAGAFFAKESSIWNNGGVADFSLELIDDDFVGTAPAFNGARTLGADIGAGTHDSRNSTVSRAGGEETSAGAAATGAVDARDDKAILEKLAEAYAAAYVPEEIAEAFAAAYVPEEIAEAYAANSLTETRRKPTQFLLSPV